MSHEEYLKQFGALLEKRDWRAAFELASQRYERNNLPGPLINMCDALLVGQDFERLEAQLKKLRSIKADDAEVVRVHALHAEATGDFLAAIRHWSSYADLKPGKPMPRFKVANLCLEDGRYLRLADLIENIRQKWPDHSQLRYVEHQLDQHIQAEAPVEIRKRALALSETHDWIGARRAWEQLYMAAPHDIHAFFRTCDCLLELGDYRECAATVATRIHTIGEAARFHEIARRLVTGLVKSGEGLELAGDAVLAAASDASILTAVRMSLTRRGETSDLEQLCDHVARRGHVELLHDVISELLAHDEPEMAARLGDAAVKAAPDHPLGAFLALRIASASRDEAKIRSLLAAMQQSPEVILASVDSFSAYLIAHLETIGEDSFLAELVRSASERLLNTRSARFDMADALFTAGRLEVLSAVLHHTPALDEAVANDVLVLQAAFLGREGHASDAGARLARLLADWAREDQGRFVRLVEVLFDRDRIGTLQAALAAAGDALLSDIRLVRVRAQLASRELRWAEAADLWGKIFAKNPNDIWSQINRANALSRLDDPAEARRAFDVLSASKELSVGPIRSELAVCAARMGDLTAARDLALEVLQSVSGSDLRPHQKTSLARVLSLVGLPKVAWPLYGYKGGVERGEGGRLAIILDPGLTVTSGHHVNYNLFAWRLIRALIAEGASLSPLVLTREVADRSSELAEVRVAPALHFEPYAFDDFSVVHQCLPGLNTSFHYDLSRLELTDRVGLVIMHSMRAIMVDGFSQWVDDIFQDTRGFVVVGLIEVDHMMRDGDIVSNFKKIYKDALTRLVNNKNIGLLVYVETQFGKEFLDELGIKGLSVKVFPYLAASLCLDYRVDHPSDDGARLCLGMVGGTRDIRGSHLVPKVIVETRDLAEHIRWKLQLDTTKVRAIMPAAELPYLADMRGCEHVEVIEGVLSVREYFEILSELDVVILPYQERYTVSGSGVLYEAIYMGKFLVVPRHTFMPAVLEALNHPHWVMDEATDCYLEQAVRWVSAERSLIRRQLDELNRARPQQLPSDEFYDLVKTGLEVLN